MARVQSIWFHGEQLKNGKMKVSVGLFPAGEVSINVDVPKQFFDLALKMAQTAADAHEAQMQAALLPQFIKQESTDAKE